MVDKTNLAYSYIGELHDLATGTKKACEKMALIIKDEPQLGTEGFSLSASQKINWLSTNWPVKFKITAEKVGVTYVVHISGSSSMGSITQSGNNHAKAQELLSLIKAYCPSK